MHLLPAGRCARYRSAAEAEVAGAFYERCTLATSGEIANASARTEHKTPSKKGAIGSKHKVTLDIVLPVSNAQLMRWWNWMMSMSGMSSVRRICRAGQG